jgi:diguanylate cyclase (GGDEF)-like protein
LCVPGFAGSVMAAQPWPPGSFLGSYAVTSSPVTLPAVLSPFERLATLYHELLGQESLGELLEHAADAVLDLVPCSSLMIAEVDPVLRMIVPVVVRGSWPEETLRLRPRVGEGLIGWAVERERPVLSNEAHRDPRAGHTAGTPAGEPEAIACFPLIAREQTLGALSLSREGEGAGFSEQEFDMARRFADAVTLALANAKTRARLEELARTDDLTGCLNRRGLYYRFPSLAAAAAATHQQLGLLLVDLDQFKQVNDRFGHATGDLVLQHVVHQLRAWQPEQTCIARLGGDEFAILIPTAPNSVGEIACAAANAIADVSFPTRHGPVSITASVGTAVANPTTATLATLLEQADATMYTAKAAPPAQTNASPDRRHHRSPT